MPEHRYDVIVIGAGLAGCSSAIQLARKGHEVLLLEKKKLPTHKLCGEFLSPESRSAFENLGVLRLIHEAGAHPISEYRATTPGDVETQGDLPRTALGLSRYRLDKLLFRAAERAGATVRDSTSVRDVEGSFSGGFQVSTSEENYKSRVVIGAYGKRGLLDQKLERSFLQEKSATVAFKAHYRGEMSPHRIELHAFSGGYCGVQQVEDGIVNVCWIGETDQLKEAGGTPEEMLKDSGKENIALAERMDGFSQISEKFEAVSQVHLKPKSVFEGDVCMVGDTAGMIAPMCGDGMSMALDGASVLAPLIDKYLRCEISSDSLKATYESAWRSTFSKRMRLGRWLHSAYGQPLLARIALRACRTMPLLERWVIRETRG